MKLKNNRLLKFQVRDSACDFFKERYTFFATVFDIFIVQVCSVTNRFIAVV
jgi:hypothetical protein